MWITTQEITVNLAKAQAIQGWMEDIELECLAQHAASAMMILEIGSWKGRSTRVLADNTPGVVHCIDTFRGTPGDDLQANDGDIWEIFSRNTQDLQDRGKLHAHVGTSEVVIPMAMEWWRGIFDLVFIDGNHSYEAVLKDIALCKSLLRQGGVMLGHDYSSYWSGVQSAVGESLPGVELACHTIWKWVKEKP